MGTFFAYAFVISTAVMVAGTLVLGFQQWRDDRREPPNAPNAPKFPKAPAE